VMREFALWQGGTGICRAIQPFHLRRSRRRPPANASCPFSRRAGPGRRARRTCLKPAVWRAAPAARPDTCLAECPVSSRQICSTSASRPKVLRHAPRTTASNISRQAYAFCALYRLFRNTGNCRELVLRGELRGPQSELHMLGPTLSAFHTANTKSLAGHRTGVPAPAFRHPELSGGAE
jgi:hypothetical protein